MYYTIYKITNKVNNKIYIGKHQTQDLNDGYMGSGKHLKHAIKKYGIENFKKEILFKFDNEEEMNAKEVELVNEEFILREDTYNICVGGQGGFSYINLTITQEDKIKRSKNGRKKADKSLIEKYGSLHNAHKQWADAGRKAFSLKLKNDEEFRNKVIERLDNIRIKAHSEEAREKKTKTYKKLKFQQGTKNSQYGTIWITNGEEAKKIKKDQVIPEGWRCGRK